VSLASQILTLCAVALLGTAVLSSVRGLPEAPAEAPPVAGACRAPIADTFVDPHPEVRWISQEDARALVGQPGVAFVDCRAREEFEAGHVSGSLHLNLQNGEISKALLGKLRGDATVITYCEASGGTCQRSHDMASRLREAGLPDVRVLEGGMPAWLHHGYPAESGMCTDCEATR
jgi:rhodanese-related sulfurtransferase